MEKTILIIEDDKDILDMMTYILSDAGFRIVASLEGLSPEYVREIGPVLILLDDRLVTGFGHDLCLKLKTNPATRPIPIVLVSAVKELALVAAESGADAYLRKPFDLDELVALVRRFS